MTPNFLIAGAARCGTTALADTLNQHPDVFVTDPKETHFWAHAGHPLTYRGPGDEQMMNRRVVTDPRRFLTLFEASGEAARRGEGSVSTLTRPDVSIPNIERYAEAGTKIVVVLREPTERAYSSYLYLRGRGHEPLDDFRTALAAEAERGAEGYHHLWLYETLGHYRVQLEPFVSAFGSDLHCIILEEYKDDAAGHLRRLCDFLGVDDAFPFVTDRDVNRGGEPRSALLTRGMNALRAVPAIQRSVKALTSQALRERIRATNLSRPVLDEAVRRDLRNRFGEDIDYVRSLLGRSIPSWQA